MKNISKLMIGINKRKTSRPDFPISWKRLTYSEILNAKYIATRISMKILLKFAGTIFVDLKSERNKPKNKIKRHKEMNEEIRPITQFLRFSLPLNRLIIMSFI